MITSFFVALLALASIYAVLASIETGIALSMLFPKLSNNPDSSKNIYTPLWEITNVFLVFAVIFVSVIFNNALSSASKIALVPLIFAGAALLLRAIIGLYIFYSSNKIGLIPKLLLITSSYLAPLSVAVVGIDFFLGSSVWSSASGLILLSCALLGITTIGVSFINRHKLPIHNNLKYLMYILFGLWAIDLGFMLPHVLQSTDFGLLRTSLTILIASIAVSAVGFFLYSAAKDKVYELYQYAILIGFITPILLGLDMRPYFINHVISIKTAYGAAAYQSSLVIGTIIATPIVLIGLGLLLKLLLDQQKTKP
jgi:cytochrome bd-type quinol oxidase subunit 2